MRGLRGRQQWQGEARRSRAWGVTEKEAASPPSHGCHSTHVGRHSSMHHPAYQQRTCLCAASWRAHIDSRPSSPTIASASRIAYHMLVMPVWW